MNKRLTIGWLAGTVAALIVALAITNRGDLPAPQKFFAGVVLGLYFAFLWVIIVLHFGKRK